MKKEPIWKKAFGGYKDNNPLIGPPTDPPTGKSKFTPEEIRRYELMKKYNADTLQSLFKYNINTGPVEDVVQEGSQSKQFIRALPKSIGPFGTLNKGIATVTDFLEITDPIMYHLSPFMSGVKNETPRKSDRERLDEAYREGNQQWEAEIPEITKISKSFGTKYPLDTIKVFYDLVNRNSFSNDYLMNEYDRKKYKEYLEQNKKSPILEKGNQTIKRLNQVSKGDATDVKEPLKQKTLDFKSPPPIINRFQVPKNKYSK